MTRVTSSRRLHHVHSALQSSLPAAAAAESDLPIVAIIDMENKDGTIYSGVGDDTIELNELLGTAKVSRLAHFYRLFKSHQPQCPPPRPTAPICCLQVVYTGAASIEEVDQDLLTEVSAVLLRRCPFGEKQLAKMPKLKVVLRMGAGYDNVDTEACSRADVIACNCPDAWVEEVADSTLCLMLALIRRTFDLVKMVSAGGGWTRQAELQQKGISRVRCASRSLLT